MHKYTHPSSTNNSGFDGVMGAHSLTLFRSLARAHTQTHTHTHVHTHKLSLSNTPSSSNGWAFDGGLSEAFALFTLGDSTNDTAGGGRGVEEGGVGGKGHWIDEIVMYTGVGRYDHHISMFRLWYSDVPRFGV